MKILPAIVSAIALVTPAFAAEEIETASYEVVKEADGVELRRYAPRIVAKVSVDADDRDAASSKGFMPLAGYIFGKNGPKEKIAMTAPVTTEQRGIPSGSGEKIAMTSPVTTAPQDGGAYTVRFTMPSKWTMETLPEPANEAVKLVEVPETLMIAAGYKGKRTDERIAELEAKLAAYAEKNGLKRTGGFITAGYDGPDVPADERRWDVMSEVAQ